MPDYQFDALSSFEFERLSKGLLEAELGMRLEIFGAGADGGIDLRKAKPGSPNWLVVQCKHYAGSRFGSLLSALEKERPKLEKLRPDRYLVATSRSLTPANKQKIVTTLAGFCDTTDDVFGREDLNGLLERHPEVEKQHHKLWLTSTPALERALHARVFDMGQRTLEEARARVALYVQNPSLDRALELLEDAHYCVIAGIPGIG